MSLKNLELVFLSMFDINNIKREIEQTLSKILVSEDTLLEFTDIIPEGSRPEEFIIKYSKISVYLNCEYPERSPYFNVRYCIIEPYKFKELFYYDTEYDCDGVMVDEYLYPVH